MLYPDTRSMPWNQVYMAAATELPPVSPRYTNPVFHGDPPCKEDTTPRKFHIIMRPFPGMMKEDIDPLTANLLSTPASGFLRHQ